MSCDLHIHSTCSDGAVPIERLASIAARTGLHAIALSDHDTLLSAQYAYAHTGQDGVELIPAVELTGYDFERQHRVHLLCYYPDVDCPALREHCAVMKERRNACALQNGDDDAVLQSGVKGQQGMVCCKARRHQHLGRGQLLGVGQSGQQADDQHIVGGGTGAEQAAAQHNNAVSYTHLRAHET